MRGLTHLERLCLSLLHANLINWRKLGDHERAPPRTVVSIFQTTDPKFRGFTSCSQNRSTLHPCSSSARVFSLSRDILSSIFSSHHSRLVLGGRKCSGQPCQKHPSTKTQTLAALKTISALQRNFATGRVSFLNLSPARCNPLRRSFSGDVSRDGIACITRRTRSDDAAGARDLIDDIYPGMLSSTSAGASS